MKQVAVVFLLLVLVAVFGVLGEMDRNDAVIEQAHYCSMVADGYWPDFHHSFKDECGGSEPPKYVAKRD